MTPSSSPIFSSQLVSWWRRIGGASLTLSLLFHAGLLTLAGLLLIKVNQQEVAIDFMPGTRGNDADRNIEAVQSQIQEVKRDAINRKHPIARIVVDNPNTEFGLPMNDYIDIPALPDKTMGLAGSPAAAGPGSGPVFSTGRGPGSQSGNVALNPVFSSRCSTAERLTKLRESGGTAECERAVSNALEYLKTKQNADGSWGTRNKCAMTGFALLCYLGRCETPDSPFYGDTVMKGALFLIETQKKNPLGLFSQDSAGNAPAYEHGIATYALGEMYTLARMGSRALPGMREAFEDGVKTIIDNQQESGSWVYDTDKGGYAQGREDLSVTGWQYQALKAAKLTNLKISGLHPAIDKTVEYLKKKQTNEGGIGGANREAGYNQWELTGTGALGLQTLGGGKGRSEIKKAMAFARDLFTKEPPVWQNNTLYSCYYYQQAFFQAGGDDWKFWNDAYLSQILANQKPDGSWQHAKTTQGGDWVYATALNTLMLEVYYRYLKVGDREARSLFER